MKHAQRGFTLIELSIVLLIIGLIIGGTLGVRAIIRNSELQSITTEINKIQTATKNFEEKYNALPGDMPNATAIWGQRNAVFATCINSAAPAPNALATCNGNDNGKIMYQDTDSMGVPFTSKEDMRQWNHLSNAHMYEGSYSGTNASATVVYAGKVNIPTSRIDGGAFHQWYTGPRDAADPYWFADDYLHVVRFGANGDANLPAIRPILSTREVWSMDKKFDDGLPDKGNIVNFKDGAPSSGTCVADNAGVKEYDLDAPGLLCVYIAKMPY